MLRAVCGEPLGFLDVLIAIVCDPVLSAHPHPPTHLFPGYRESCSGPSIGSSVTCKGALFRAALTLQPFVLPSLPAWFLPHPLSGRCLEHSLHAQHMQPEIAGQDTAQGERKGRGLGRRGRQPFGLRGASLVLVRLGALAWTEGCPCLRRSAWRRALPASAWGCPGSREAGASREAELGG